MRSWFSRHRQSSYLSSHSDCSLHVKVFLHHIFVALIERMTNGKTCENKIYELLCGELFAEGKHWNKLWCGFAWQIHSPCEYKFNLRMGKFATHRFGNEQNTPRMNWQGNVECSSSLIVLNQHPPPQLIPNITLKLFSDCHCQQCRISFSNLLRAVNVKRNLINFPSRINQIKVNKTWFMIFSHFSSLSAFNELALSELANFHLGEIENWVICAFSRNWTQKSYDAGFFRWTCDASKKINFHITSWAGKLSRTVDTIIRGRVRRWSSWLSRKS